MRVRRSAVRIEGDLLVQLEAIALKDGTTKTDLVNQAVADYLGAVRSPKPKFNPIANLRSQGQKVEVDESEEKRIRMAIREVVRVKRDQGDDFS